MPSILRYDITEDSVDYDDNEAADQFNLSLIVRSAIVIKPTQLPAHSNNIDKKNLPPISKWIMNRSNTKVIKAARRAISCPADIHYKTNTLNTNTLKNINKTTTLKSILKGIYDNSTTIIAITAVLFIISSITLIAISAIFPQTIAFIISPALNLPQLQVICSFTLTAGVLLGSKALFFSSANNSDDDNTDLTSTVSQVI